MKLYLFALLVFCCTAAVLSATVKKGCNEKFRGCTLRENECECGVDYGCKSPWPYVSIKECKKDLRGENDKCRKNPCWHGKCVQVLLPKKRPDRKWECACAGSGYYGKKCHLKCPRSEHQAPLPKDFPNDCIY